MHQTRNQVCSFRLADSMFGLCVSACFEANADMVQNPSKMLTHLRKRNHSTCGHICLKVMTSIAVTLRVHITKHCKQARCCTGGCRRVTSLPDDLLFEVSNVSFVLCQQRPSRFHCFVKCCAQTRNLKLLESACQAAHHPPTTIAGKTGAARHDVRAFGNG